jgi:hypothetical protein
LRATFVAPGEPDEAAEIGGVKKDIAWVRYEEGELEGTLGKLPYGQIRPRGE